MILNLKNFQAELNRIAGNAPKDGERCVKCREPFTDSNVFTPAGWREAKISGYCEKCWGVLFADEGE